MDFGKAWGETSNTKNLQAEPWRSEDGVVSVIWAVPPQGTVIELQHAREAGFDSPVVRYRGGEGGSVLTGLPEGPHFFRIRSLDGAGGAGAWSPTAEVEVEFFSRGRLILLLSLGGVVVLATIGTILAGHFTAKREEAEA